MKNAYFIFFQILEKIEWYKKKYISHERPTRKSSLYVCIWPRSLLSKNAPLVKVLYMAKILIIQERPTSKSSVYGQDPYYPKRPTKSSEYGQDPYCK